MLVTPDPYWKPIMEKAQQKLGTINEQKSICYGFDSFQKRNDQVYAKSGGQAGYSSYISWSPSIGGGVFILTDQSGYGRQLAEVSDQIMEILQNENQK